LLQEDGGGDARPLDGAVSCTADTTVCEGNTLVVCDAASNPTVSTCSFGCDGGGTRCADLDPSNDLAVYLDVAATAQPMVLTGGAIIDTSARTGLC
jgi:hypothetical protein